MNKSVKLKSLVKSFIQKLQPEPKSMRRPEFVLFGDSLTEWGFSKDTEGFGYLLEWSYAKKVNIVNEGADFIKQATQTSVTPEIRGKMTSDRRLPEFVLFGASMTEWSFDEKTHGFGWFLRYTYDGKVEVLNEGQAGYTSTALKRDFDRIIQRATAPGASPTLLFTIFIGANDACIMGKEEYVPWPKFSANIRSFIETILTQDTMAETKIVLITPPPINGSEGTNPPEATPEKIAETIAWAKEGTRYKTYMSKKRYAEGLMGIAKEYEETGRVVGLNFWKGIVDEKIKEGEIGTWEDLEESGLWPGSGLIGAKKFEAGWFTDGLHLNKKGYGVLNKMLMETVVGKWPDLAPEAL